MQGASYRKPNRLVNSVPANFTKEHTSWVGASWTIGVHFEDLIDVPSIFICEWEPSETEDVDNTNNDNINRIDETHKMDGH